MSLDYCKALLDVMAMLNDGPDHGCAYQLEALPPAISSELAIREWIRPHSSARGGVQSLEALLSEVNVQFIGMSDNWQDDLAKVVQSWFFEEMHSPTVRDEFSRKNVLNSFMQALCTVVGEAECAEVKISHCHWPELRIHFPIVWVGYIFERGDSRWILEFGYSD